MKSPAASFDKTVHSQESLMPRSVKLPSFKFESFATAVKQKVQRYLTSTVLEISLIWRFFPSYCNILLSPLGTLVNFQHKLHCQPVPMGSRMRFSTLCL